MSMINPMITVLKFLIKNDSSCNNNNNDRYYNNNVI